MEVMSAVGVAAPKQGVDEVLLLPPRPAAPRPSDCCGTGCCPCVHDLYQRDIEDWKKQCKRIKNGGDAAADSGETSPAALCPARYTEFELQKITPISSNTFLYTFLIENNGWLGLKLGQHVILKQLTSTGVTVTRQYTPVSELDDRGHFDVLIKLYDKGKMTSLIKDWSVGERIPWRGPFGSFSYSRNSFKRLVFLGAGTGIAPLYQLIRHVTADPDEETHMILLYASKTFNDILLRDELLELTSHWNFEMVHYLSGEKEAGLKRYREQVHLERLTKAGVKDEIGKGPVDRTLVLICGTKSFEKDMINCTKDMEIPDKKVFKF